jgi:imidazole glycerol-phosphate synthase subunit HisH
MITMNDQQTTINDQRPTNNDQRPTNNHQRPTIMIAIIKYNAGNVQSVQYALQRLGVASVVTDDDSIIQNADKVIFPGVGHASPAMQYLRERNLDKLIVSLQQPVLGICLGLQLMCRHSEEGDTNCLGIFNEQVRLFPASPEGNFKIPQIGWNNIYGYKSALFKGLAEDAFVYTVHSYFAATGDETIATTDYIVTYSAALEKDNFYAVQFHPEKSGTVGETILKNFISLS